MRRKALILAMGCIVFAPLMVVPSKALESDISAPFVGCPSDGQLGPLDAPRGTAKGVRFSREIAQRLAYYKAEQGVGVLAPKGWYCFATYGSNGTSLYVSPLPLNSKLLLSDQWRGFTEPVIQVSDEAGDTSGRFAVARMIARVFPKHKAFVKSVIAERIEPSSNFPSGPYPNDKLVYKSSDVVEYRTPANTKGLGTQSRLLPSDLPISGVAILVGKTPDLLFLASRLPASMADLRSAILQQTEEDANHIEP
jgi:hypothetical protein